MKNLILAQLLAFLLSQPEYTVLTNNNPYPGKLFIHSMSEYMAIPVSYTHLTLPTTPYV